jgi:hypothetical protein
MLPLPPSPSEFELLFERANITYSGDEGKGKRLLYEATIQ